MFCFNNSQARPKNRAQNFKPIPACGVTLKEKRTMEDKCFVSKHGYYLIIMDYPAPPNANIVFSGSEAECIEYANKEKQLQPDPPTGA